MGISIILKSLGRVIDQNAFAFTINLNKVYIVSEEFMKYMKNLKKFYIGMGDILN